MVNYEVYGLDFISSWGTTWLITRLDMIVLVHSCCCWCAFRVAVLLGDGCPHGVLQLHLHMARCIESLMVIGITWCCIRMLLLSCMLLCLTGSSVHKNCMFVHPSIREHILHVRSSFHPWTYLLDDHLFTSTFLCMNCLFIYWWTCPSACTPFFHLTRRHAMPFCVPVSVVTHEEMKSNP